MLAPGTRVADAAVRREARSASGAANFIMSEFELWRRKEEMMRTWFVG